MDLLDYQNLARRTAVYQEVGASYLYLSLGLAGEAGEVAEKVADLVDGEPFDERAHRGLVKELGDVLWYMSQGAAEAGTTLADLAVAVPEVRDVPAVVEADPAALMVPALRLTAKAGRVAEIAKKVLRDNDSDFDAPARTRISVALGETYRALVTVCETLGVSLSEVADANIAKLHARSLVGTLNGDGDDR